MRRDECPVRPYQQAAIDFNGPQALLFMGEDIRPYPRYLPIPHRAVASSSQEWTFAPYRKSLVIFPQMYFLLGRDIEMDEERIGADAVLGYGVGLCVMDDGIRRTIDGGSPRDLGMAHWYSQYADDCYLLFPELFVRPDIKDITLTVSSATLGCRRFDQGDLTWNAVGLLNAISPLNAARMYDLVMLGASHAPFMVAQDICFGEEEVIEVDAGVLGAWRVTVHDRRDAGVFVPKWTPRPLACDPAYLDVN